MNIELSLFALSRSFILSFGAAGGLMAPHEEVEGGASIGGDNWRRPLVLVARLDAGLGGAPMDAPAQRAGA